jgi:rod shape determining protein RodA
MCVGLLPITGIPLPFVSLGGTAMIVNFISLGVMLNLSVERNILQKE